MLLRMICSIVLSVHLPRVPMQPDIKLRSSPVRSPQTAASHFQDWWRQQAREKCVCLIECLFQRTVNARVPMDYVSGVIFGNSLQSPGEVARAGQLQTTFLVTAQFRN